MRIIRGPDEFDALQPGEILVAPLTASMCLYVTTAGVGAAGAVPAQAGRAARSNGVAITEMPSGLITITAG
jgi:hypothetical protein